MHGAKETPPHPPPISPEWQLCQNWGISPGGQDVELPQCTECYCSSDQHYDLSQHCFPTLSLQLSCESQAQWAFVLSGCPAHELHSYSRGILSSRFFVRNSVTTHLSPSLLPSHTLHPGKRGANKHTFQVCLSPYLGVEIKEVCVESSDLAGVGSQGVVSVEGVALTFCYKLEFPSLATVFWIWLSIESLKLFGC